MNRLQPDVVPVVALLMTGQLTGSHCQSVLFGLRGLDAEQMEPAVRRP